MGSRKSGAMKRLLDLWVSIRYGNVYAPKPPLNNGKWHYALRYKIWLLDAWIDRNCGAERKRRWEDAMYGDNNPSIKLHKATEEFRKAVLEWQAREENLHDMITLIKKANHLLKEEIVEKDKFIKILESMVLDSGNAVFRTKDEVEQTFKIDLKGTRKGMVYRRVIKAEAQLYAGPPDTCVPSIETRDYEYRGERDRVGRPIFEEV